MLKPCQECGRAVSTQAMACPTCGNVIRSAANWSPGVAAVLSFFIPGLGQLYKGQFFGGLLWFILTGIGYICFILPGLFFHLWCIVGAMMGDPHKAR